MFEISGGMNIEVTVDMGAAKGERGYRFVPNVSQDGILTWTNNGGLDNPEPVNLTGPKGQGFTILGTYPTLEALRAAVPNAAQSDFYNVGSSAPYDIYMWNAETKDWENQGQLQGQQGAVFIPSVSSGGVISWTNDGGLKNPDSVNIRGTKGAVYTPAVSAAGVLSWTNDGELENPANVDLAQAFGMDNKVDKVAGKGLSANDFTDTLKNKLDGIAENANAYTLPATLPVSMITGLAPVATSGAYNDLSGRIQLSSVAVSLPSASWVAGDETSTQTVSVEGVTTTNSVIVQAAPESRAAWLDADVYCSAQGAGTLTFTCADAPEADLTANVLIVEVSG